MTKKELEFTTRLTREDVAGVIEALVEGLKDGRIKVQKSSESIELEVPRVIDLEVEAEVSDERAKFEIEVSWRTNRAENPDLELNGVPVDKKKQANVLEKLIAKNSPAIKKTGMVKALKRSRKK